MVRRPSERSAKKSISGSRTKHTVSRYRDLKKVKDALSGCGQGDSRRQVARAVFEIDSRYTRLTAPIVFSTRSCIISIAHMSNSDIRPTMLSQFLHCSVFADAAISHDLWLG